MKFCLTSLMSISFVFQPACSCGEVDLKGGDTDTGGEPIEIPVEIPPDIPISDDIPYESSSDWRPEPSTGTLVPEGEATFYESDVGEDFSPVGMCYFPIAFSGEVYTLLVGEDSSRYAAYRFDPRGAELSTVWYDELGWTNPSICWTGEVFLASFPIRDEGNRVFTITEAGELTRTEMVGTNDGETGGWDSMSHKAILCPASGPLIVDFGPPNATIIVDALYLLNPDGSFTGTKIDLDLPPPAMTMGKSPCGTAGHAVACFSGLPPVEKPNLFFFDREGNVRESPTFADTTHFEMGGVIADLGEAADIFWFDTPDWGDHINMAFAILGLDALFITPPSVLDLAIERSNDRGLSAAISGRDVLVVGPAPDERGVESGTYLYLFDLTGNLLGDPLILETANTMECTATPFWEGDAYAVLWTENDGLMYQRFRVE